jgi:hypothetical protein
MGREESKLCSELKLPEVQIIDENENKSIWKD